MSNTATVQNNTFDQDQDSNESVLQKETQVSSDNTETYENDSNSTEEDNEFTRAKVESLGNRIRLTDQDVDNGLDLFCYVNCTNEDNDFLKQCRGVVFHDDELVMKAFPYTSEYSTMDTKNLETISENFKDYVFFDSHEGALIRMFYFNNRWFVSTHRKLNAFQSKWASREYFGTLFKKAVAAEIENNTSFKKSLPDGDNVLARLQSVLDTEKQYMFLVRNNKDNRIVCREPDRPTVYHVGTFVDGKLNLDDEIPHFPKPAKHSFLNIDEVVHYVNNVDIRNLQGVICISDRYSFKVLHPDYQELFQARGNEPSIKFRYLQVRTNRRLTNMLYHLYPEQIETFDDYENILFEIVRTIYRAYVQRYIKNIFIKVPREEYRVMLGCHAWHCSNKAENRISIEQVFKVLNVQPATALNRMIRRFKVEQYKQKEQQNYLNSSSIDNSPVTRLPSGLKMVSPLLVSSRSNLPPLNEN